LRIKNRRFLKFLFELNENEMFRFNLMKMKFTAGALFSYKEKSGQKRIGDHSVITIKFLLPRRILLNRMVRFGTLPLFAGPKTRWCSFLFQHCGEKEKNHPDNYRERKPIAPRLHSLTN
jgi:hypothetical protein